MLETIAAIFLVLDGSSAATAIRDPSFCISLREGCDHGMGHSTQYKSNYTDPPLTACFEAYYQLKRCLNTRARLEGETRGRLVEAIARWNARNPMHGLRHVADSGG